MIGRSVGNYVVSAKIGQGGMGCVYLANHPRIGRKVAIKVLLPQLSTHPDLVKRFFTEARAANAIHNEHIIEILDFGELEGGSPYFVMEWLEGESLGDLLERKAVLPRDRCVHIALGLGEALSAAHAAGIVHRDLKPDNIFLVNRNHDPDFVKVLDFGIAKLLLPEESLGLKTESGQILGTPAYMSPEQCRGQHIDQRTDIYAMGVILYEILTGQRPFEGRNVAELLLHQMTLMPVAPKTRVPGLPADLDTMILRALEKDPNDRFERIDEMLEVLRRHAPLPPSAAPPAGSLVVRSIRDARTSPGNQESDAAHWSESTLPAPKSPMTPPQTTPAPDTTPLPMSTRMPMPMPVPSPTPMASPMPVLTPTPRAESPATRMATFELEMPLSEQPRLELEIATRPEPVLEIRQENKRRPALLALLMLIAAVVVAAALYGKSGLDPSSPSSPIPTPAPRKLETTPNPGSSSASQISFSCRTIPPDATIRLDGELLANPFSSTRPKDTRLHRLTISKVGYEPLTMELVFDQDQPVVVELNPIPSFRRRNGHDSSAR